VAAQTKAWKSWKLANATKKWHFHDTKVNGALIAMAKLFYL
jgi:hypothetical protein